MAQIVKLRRSSVSGQKPTNSNLQLGELALNTTDGKVYMAKSGSLGPSVEELISTNTVNTGSIHLVGDITASIFTGSFTGDGTNLYNIPASGVTGLNLTRIADGNATASISNSSGLKINTNTEITGSLIVSSGSAVFDASLQLTENSSLILNSGSNLYVYDGGIISGTFKGNGALLTDLPYATTASNHFFGDQTITGSVTITQNLTVLGSSSIVYSTASQLIVEDNIIVVNASYPAERFAGLEVHDSGSNGNITASFLWDGQNNRWVYRNTSDAHYGGAMFIAGPRNTGSLGDEPTLTSGRIPKSIGGDHIGDSIISESGTTITIGGTLVANSISGAFDFYGLINRPTLVSGSSQINITGTDGYTTFSSSVKDRIDTVTGSITDLSSSVKDRIDVVTGSITFLSSSVKDRIDIVTGSITDLSSSVKDRIDNVTSSITFLSSSVKDRIDVVTSSITFLSSSVKDRIDLVTSSVTFLSSSVKDRIDVVTGSITDLSSSVKDRIDVVTGSVDSLNLFTSSYTTNSFTGSFIGDGSGLYNIPASGVTGLQLDKIINGNASASINNSGFYVNRDVFVDGTITAKEIHIDYVTSSVLYQSGSTKFGDSNDDTHQFTGSVKISGSLQSDSITGSFSGSFAGNASGLVNVPFHISGSDVNGGTYNKQFSKLQFDDSTGLNVSESVAGTAFISIGSHFRDIFVSGSDMLRATGSDAFEIIPEGGIEVTTSITDTNSNGYVKELRLSTTTLSSSLDTRIDNLSSSVVYQSETSSMTVLSSSYALTASFALNAGAGNEGRTYVHVQSTPSTYWVVTHNLGEEYPAITVYDSFDNVIIPSKISTVDETGFTVEFSSNQAGKVSATVGGGLPFVSASFVDYVLAVNNDVPYWKGGVISGSAQIILTGTTGYNTFSSSVATTTLNIKNRVDSIEAKTGSYATTGSNLFIGTQTLSGSILPSVDNLYDLGSSTHQWRDVYISSGSLYIDGTKVISSTTQELQITTDSGQSIKILENGTDSIILQTVDGDVELKSSGDGDILLDPTNGKIMLKGPVEILNGQKIQSSVGGTPVVFANDIVVSGSIELTGTIDGIDLTSFSSSTNTRLTNLESSGGSLNSFTASANTRLGALETESGSVRTAFNSYTSSANGRLSSIETSTGSLNTFSSSTSLRLTSLETESGSIRTDLNSYTSSANGRLTSIEVSTGSLNSFTSSTAGSLIAIQTSTASLNSFTASTNTRLGALETSTSSLNTFSSSTNGRLTSIETSTGSLNTFTSSATGRLNTIEVSTGSLNSFTSSTATSLTALNTSTASLNTFSSSTNTRLGALETSTGSLNSFTSSTTTSLTAINASTASLNSFTSSTNVRLGALETESGSIRTDFNSYTSSNNSTNTTQNNRLTALETSTSSLNTFSSSTNSRLTSIETSTSSLNTFSSSTNTRLGALETESGSIRTAFNSYTSSNDGTNTTQNSRLTSLEGKTGSYATTGSNIFIGTQIVTGSLFVTQDLIIGGSSSIQHITSSQLNIGDNIITVNAQNPSIRFGGLAVIDSGSSPQVSGSILFDSTNDQWIFVHQNQSTVTSSVLLMGPETYNNLGGESYLTQNRIPKGSGIEHLRDSNITDTGTKVSINSNTEITGTFVVTGTALVSGSSQINHNTTTNYVANEHINHTSVSISAGNGLSGGGDITTNRTLTLDTGSVHFLDGVKKELNTEGVISGSAQIVAALPSGTVSGSSQVLNGSGVWSGSAQLPSGVVSGSSQVSFSGLSGVPSGLVSGSSQISFGSISGVPSGLVSGSSQVLNGSGVWSGSAQLPAGTVSGSSQVSFSGLSGVPSGLVSGSSQISFSSISGVPTGLVSGSSQIDHNLTTNYVANQHIDHTTVSISAGSGLSGGGTIAATRTLTLDTGSVHFTNGTRATLSFTAGSGGYNSSTGVITIPTNNNQLTNGAGYITSYTETDTLSSVTARGASTTSQIISTSSAGDGSIISRNDGSGTTWRGRIGHWNATADKSVWLATYNGFAVVGAHNNALSAWADLLVNCVNNNGDGGTTRLSTSSFVGSNVILHAGNYTSYSPSLTGTNASGTWGINITGNAATATSATDSTKLPLAGGTLTGDLRFNNAGYGRIAFTDNYHGLILRGNPNNAAGDITAGDVTSLVQHSGDFRFYRTNGSVNEIYFQVNATAPYWRGNVIYHAGNIPTWNQNTTGTAGSISGFNNPTTSATANTIAYRDSGGDLYARYMFAVHFNQSGGNSENPTIGQIWTQNTTDNYCRKSTPAHFISQLGLITTSNIGSQSVNYANSAGSAPNASNQNSAYLVTPGEGNGLKFWASDAYKISMGASSVYQYGTVTDYSIKIQMNTGDPGRGFTWGREGIVPIASLNATSGNMQLAGSLSTGGSILPLSNNSVNLGSPSLGWANVYTNDLHLSNMNKPEGNDIDGTNGNWTIQEGAENLYIINNNNGKKFKISLEEI